MNKEAKQSPLHSPKVPRKPAYTPSLSEKILAFKIGNPGMSARKIAKALRVDHKTVLSHLRKTESQSLEQEIEMRTMKRLLEIREEALSSLHALVKGDKVAGKDMTVWLNAVKFVLGPIVNSETEKQAEELIFETVISDGGIVTQSVISSITA